MPLQFKSKRLSFFSNLLLDFSLLSVAFLVVYYFKRRHIYVEKTILLYLPVYFVTWLGATLLTRKFRHYDQEDYLQRLRPYLMAILLQIGSMSILLFAFNWLDLSRFIVFGSVGLFFLMEMMFIAGAFFLPIVAKRKSFSGYSYSVTFFFLEFALISGIFLAIYFYKRGHLVLTDEYKSIFLVIFFSWMFISLFTHRFRIPEDRNYLKVLRPFIRSSLLTIGLVSFFVFTFRILEYSRLILFGSLGLFMVFEVMMVTIYYLYHKPQETDEPVPNIFSATLLEEPEPILEDTTVRLHEGKYRVPEEAEGGISIRRKLCNVYLRHLPEVYQFLDEVVDLESVDYMTAESIHASHPYNVEVLPDNTLHFFMNLHEINDIRRINRYFIEVNKKLRDGAIFVGRFEPYGKRRQRFLKNYSYRLGNILYVFDFIWKRVFPKLPFLQKIYFGVSKGKGRVLSRAEGLGRLYYCGFEVIANREIDNYTYFVVRKAKEPSNDENPSYSPVFKMKRSGKGGKPIYVYKFRTMHPYSEYLQDYVLRINGYSSIGKPKDDFRVTAWGKVMRKYWLDELPQLLNLFKGEMTLVGVRPISQRFLNEFPEDIRELRKKYKPSCIPAYVSLLKQSKDGFIEAETAYILEKEKHPFTTDLKYLWLALYNIATNKIRSA